MRRHHRIARVEGDPHRVPYEPDGDGGLELDDAGIKATGTEWAVMSDYGCECGEEFVTEEAAARHIVYWSWIEDLADYMMEFQYLDVDEVAEHSVVNAHDVGGESTFLIAGRPTDMDRRWPDDILRYRVDAIDVDHAQADWRGAAVRRVSIDIEAELKNARGSKQRA